MSADHFGRFLMGGDNGVRVLIKGPCDRAMKGALLDRFEKRGEEYQITIFVLFTGEVGGEQGDAVAALRKWAYAEGVISEQCMLEDWM
jgi:hypothetical protein